MTVLVAVTEQSTTDRTVDVGHELAEKFGDELYVLHVLSREEADRRVNERPDYFVDDAAADAEIIAQTVVDQTIDADSDVTARGRVGDPNEEIVAEAERIDARYLVIGGRKRTPVGKAIFGSTTQSVLLQTWRPVITVPIRWSRRAGTPAPIVAAIDRPERASKVVREAWAIALALDQDLYVVHVIERAEFAALERTDAGGAGWEPSDDEIQSVAAEIASETAEPIADAFVGVGLVGEPSTRVVEYADDRGAGYIVTAGRSRSPIGKILFGSVTQSILLAADRPVVTLLGDR